jgi:hypothetical protein
MYALNPDGTLRWKYDSISAIDDDAVIGSDGTIYFTNQDDKIFALDPEGTLKWKFQARSIIERNNLIITDENTLIAISDFGHFYVLNDDGSLKWHQQFPYQDIHPILTDEGIMYLIMNVDFPFTAVVKAFDFGCGLQKNSPWPCYKGNNYRTGNNSDIISAFEHNHSAQQNHDTIPQSYSLDGNYPNPFNTATTIIYSLPTADHVTITVYSLSGQKVATLVDRYCEAGTHRVVFDGSHLPSSVYFCRMEASGFAGTEKMLYVK